MNKEEKGMYTTHGRTRGTCGHNHKSLSTAVKCLRRDQGALQSPCYSDRTVVRTDDKELNNDEISELESLLYGE
jgi:hypothetical protein